MLGISKQRRQELMEALKMEKLRSVWCGKNQGKKRGIMFKTNLWCLHPWPCQPAHIVLQCSRPTCRHCHARSVLHSESHRQPPGLRFSPGERPRGPEQRPGRSHPSTAAHRMNTPDHLPECNNSVGHQRINISFKVGWYVLR